MVGLLVTLGSTTSMAFAQVLQRQKAKSILWRFLVGGLLVARLMIGCDVQGVLSSVPGIEIINATLLEGQEPMQRLCVLRVCRVEIPPLVPSSCWTRAD